MVTSFSGETTSDPGALDDVIAESASVRITAGGGLVYSVDPTEDVLDPAVLKTVRIMNDGELARVDDAASLRSLREALRVESFEDFVCMCPGDLALEFLDEAGRRLTVVRIDSPGILDWPLWSGVATLRAPSALRTWLAAHGSEGPLTAAERR